MSTASLRLLTLALAIGCAIALVVFLVWKFKPKPAAAKSIEDTPHPALVAPEILATDNAGTETPK